MAILARMEVAGERRTLPTGLIPGNLSIDRHGRRDGSGRGRPVVFVVVMDHASQAWRQQSVEGMQRLPVEPANSRRPINQSQTLVCWMVVEGGLKIVECAEGVTERRTTPRRPKRPSLNARFDRTKRGGCSQLAAPLFQRPAHRSRGVSVHCGERAAVRNKLGRGFLAKPPWRPEKQPALGHIIACPRQRGARRRVCAPIFAPR